jgi:ERCC4-related helicase
MTKGTRDEFYYYASQSKERKMKRILTGMQKKPGYKDTDKKQGQMKMSDYF